jgi:hypothetical protein
MMSLISEFSAGLDFRRPPQTLYELFSHPWIMSAGEAGAMALCGKWPSSFFAPVRSDMEGSYPHALGKNEREVLQWLLPIDRPGYGAYHRILDNVEVAGRSPVESERLVLVPEGKQPDFDLAPSGILAYGVIETSGGASSVTIHKTSGSQLEFQISQLSGAGAALNEDVVRKWTYSTWLPGEPCPQCGGRIREATLHKPSGQVLALAFCVRNERIWIHDGASGVTVPIPITTYYNELMMTKGIRDPKIALDARLVFTQLGKYSDGDLTRAFVGYNKMREKVSLDSAAEMSARSKRPRSAFFTLIHGLFSRKEGA